MGEGFEVDLSDIFDSFFGGGGGRGGTRSRQQTGPVQGDDLRADLTIQFKEVYRGVWFWGPCVISHCDAIVRGRGFRNGEYPNCCMHTCLFTTTPHGKDDVSAWSVFRILLPRGGVMSTFLIS